ncbi:hypothetical protein CpMRi49_01570 [Corynebacterium ulcerans]|uniref:hypothetical protein n=1 Tax=Corynebacterium ulcerans TaxID=65058 RepID=UPI0013033D34|nr:hypothetical protein [Corynebacterium ulcerans]MBL4943511.1 hypothetical protein [Corynebacterium ulcerans]QGZ24717.1 hypothetical protein CpMRi49_01570 [Corynebacterium ulcerans]QOE23430.1 hypothetical protein HUF05_01875 [Corynebacterium ulcerans]
MVFGLADIETEEDADGVTPATLRLLETIEYVRVLVVGVMTFVASTHAYEEVWRDVPAVSPLVVIECPGSRWQHPRIMETTGQISHTGASEYPHYRGYSQGNGANL